MRKTVIAALLFVLLVVAAHGLGIGLGTQIRAVYLTLNPAPLQFTPPPVGVENSQSPPGAAMAPVVQALASQVHDMSEDARRTDRLVTLLLAVASLYAIALGLHSYFGLKQITDSAEKESRRAVQLAETEAKRVIDLAERDVADMIARANKELERFKSDIREKYPEMANLDSNLRGILGGIAIFQHRDNWSDYTYAKLSERLRQETLIAESWFSVVETFGLQQLTTYRSQVTTLFHGFARFYISKYESSPANRADWERAGIYFEKALADPDPPAELLKDYGVHLIQIEVASIAEIDQQGGLDSLPPDQRLNFERLREQAASAFTRSLAKNSSEYGALSGLGWLQYRKKDYKRAIERYGELISSTAMTDRDRKSYLADSYRNRACCIWLDKHDPDGAFRDIEKSREFAATYGQLDDWKKSIRDDTDLTQLWAEDVIRSDRIFA